MKDISLFKARWSRINEAIHEAKAALTLLKSSRSQELKAMQKIGDFLETINQCINDEVNDENIKTE